MSSYKVPLYTRNPEEGSIEYLAPKESLASTVGFFSFTFYIRDLISGERTPKQADFYLKGMNYYRMMLDKKPFDNWKILIYTDKFSYDQLVKTQTIDLSTISNQMKRSDIKTIQEYSSTLLNNASIVFAIVTWPKHQRRKGVPQINGGVLRSLRSRAPFDFPDKFVFIRDADTFFEGRLKQLDFGGLHVTPTGNYNEVGHQRVKNKFRDNIYNWEKTFLEKIPEIQDSMRQRSLLIIGTGQAGLSNIVYKRPWHSNELTGKDAPFGIFAGLVSVTPGVPVYQDKRAWDDFVDYVNGRSIRNEEHPTSMLETKYKDARLYSSGVSTREPINAEAFEKYKKERINAFPNRGIGELRIGELEKNIYYYFSNNHKDHRIGRDEQLYLFIIMPRALDNLFILKADLDDITLPEIDFDFNAARQREYREAAAGEFRPVRVEEAAASETNFTLGTGWGGTRKQKKHRGTRKRKTRGSKK